MSGRRQISPTTSPEAAAVFWPEAPVFGPVEPKEGSPTPFAHRIYFWDPSGNPLEIATPYLDADGNPFDASVYYMDTEPVPALLEE